MSSNEKRPENAAAPLTPEVIRDVIKQTSAQLELKKQELEIERVDRANQFEYAKRALDAQARDFDQQRLHRARELQWKLWFSGFAVVALLTFLGFAMYLGKEEFARNIVQLLVAFFGGGAGGYALGRRRPSDPADNQSDPQ